MIHLRGPRSYLALALLGTGALTLCAAAPRRAADVPRSAQEAVWRSVDPRAEPALQAQVAAPRPDLPLPAGLRSLVTAEAVLRVSALSGYEEVQGRPGWFWRVQELTVEKRDQPAGALSDRLRQRLQEAGFDSLPTAKADYPHALRRRRQGVAETVLLGGGSDNVGSRPPTVGARLEWRVASLSSAATATYGEVARLNPALEPPRHGRHPIPEPVLRILRKQRVTFAALSGTGSTWYSLHLRTPPGIVQGEQGVLAGQLERELHRQRFVAQKPHRDDGPDLMHDLVKRDAGDTSSCRVRIWTTDAGHRLDLFVQP